MGKIILINSPPSSGKDTAAKHIYALAQRDSTSRCDGLGVPYPGTKIFLDRMSMPIKRAFAGFMQAPIDEFGNVEPYEKTKEQIIPELGISYRQWQIDFSEKFIKPLYGERTFGQLFVARCQRRFSKGIANLIVVPDCGFQIEIDVVYSAFNPADILLIRCHRPGFTFARDSRKYVRAPKGCAHFDPINDFTEQQYLNQIEAGVKCWLETPERMPREE